MSKIQNNHNKNEIELELKDKKIDRLSAEVERLKTCVLVSTIGIRKTKLQITNQHLYAQKTLKMLRLLQAKNLGIKRAISRLGDLRRVNEKQKKEILELAYCRKKNEELVLLVRKAEARNQYLQRMVYNKASPGTQARYYDKSPRVLPGTYPVSPSVFLFKQSKPLNPKASCFISMSPRHYPSISHTDDEKRLLKVVKKSSFFAAEMKRKFAEACREDKTSSSETFVNVKLNVVLEKDNNFAVKVAFDVTGSNASPISDKANLIADRQTKSSSSSLRIVLPPLADVPDHHQSSPFSSSPGHHHQSSPFSPRHRHLHGFQKVVEDGTLFSPRPSSMNWKIVDDQKLDFLQRNSAQVLSYQSAKNHAAGEYKNMMSM